MQQIYDRMTTALYRDVSLNDLVGGGDPRKVGESTLKILVSLDAICESSVVVDIGCGCGRTAIEQAKMLSRGRYLGFDIIPPLIEFCSEQISSALPNTEFHLSNAENPLYSAYIDPMRNYVEFDQIDISPSLITAFSVFTHFDYSTAMSYFKRMRSKLALGGSICVSMFLLNEASKARIDAGQSNLQFDTSEQEVVFGDKSRPLARVGWNEGFLRKSLAEEGLEIHRVIYGNWSGTFTEPYQDYLLIKPIVYVPDDFDPKRYLILNSDLVAHNANPYQHYVNYGRFEQNRHYK